MNTQTKHFVPCPAAKPAHSRLLPVAAGVVAFTVLLAGCSTTGEIDPNSPGAVLENLVVFVQDFAREALAAYLL